LVRHAIAFDRGERWPDDTQRPLTHKGEARMREVVAGLDAMRVDIQLIVTSPLVRARQTADLIVEGWPEPPELVTSDALAPGQRAAAAGAMLARYATREHIALVGHEPGLGALAAWLIGAQQSLVFKKGGVACIELPALPIAGPGQLLWLATPKMLRALKR
jgi:phosphohistidine phosphatase